VHAQLSNIASELLNEMKIEFALAKDHADREALEVAARTVVASEFLVGHLLMQIGDHFDDILVEHYLRGIVRRLIAGRTVGMVDTVDYQEQRLSNVDGGKLIRSCLMDVLSEPLLETFVVAFRSNNRYASSTALHCVVLRSSVLHCTLSVLFILHHPALFCLLCGLSFAVDGTNQFSPPSHFTRFPRAVPCPAMFCSALSCPGPSALLDSPWTKSTIWRASAPTDRWRRTVRCTCRRPTAQTASFLCSAKAPVSEAIRMR
jgi:hypothetical protein